MNSNLSINDYNETTNCSYYLNLNTHCSVHCNNYNLNKKIIA